MHFIKILFLFIGIQVLAQQGSMWIPLSSKVISEDETQSLSSQLAANDIYDVNNFSLKDAIDHFKGDYTNEIILLF